MDIFTKKLNELKEFKFFKHFFYDIILVANLQMDRDQAWPPTRNNLL